MENLIVSISVIAGFIVAFLMCFFAYRQGIKDGTNLKNDKQIQSVLKSKAKPADISDEQRKIAEKLKYINEYEVK